MGIRQINTCREVSLQVNIFQMMTFCIAFYESYLSTGKGNGKANLESSQDLRLLYEFLKP